MSFESIEKLSTPYPLREYQKNGVVFLTNNQQVLLADEMGLGKTIQTIVAIDILFKEQEITNCLVVAPVSLISNWVYEFNLWANKFKPRVIRGKKPSRETNYKLPVPIQITSYDSIRNDIDFIRENMFYDLVVIDEAQIIKNQEAKIARAIKRLPRKFSWALTGTPLENSPEDISSIFGFVSPRLISKYDFPKDIKTKMDPLTIRRKKRDLLKDLPEVIEHEVKIEMTPAQYASYTETTRGNLVNIKEGDKATRIANIFALITELKKIANFDPVSGESAKIEYLKEILQEKVSLGEKIIIFSQYVRTLEKIFETFEDLSPLLYHGGLTIDKRDQVINQFKKSEHSEILLISLKAGGVGLNLQEATTAILFDRWWNPAVEDQAISRADRYGRTQPLHAIKFLTVNSIEERINDLIEEKKGYFDDIVEGISQKNFTKLKEEDLVSLIIEKEKGKD